MKRFSCTELVELVTAYLDDELDQAARRGFDDHASACADCARYMDQFRATIGVLGALPPEEPIDDTARARLLTAFRRSRRP